MREKLIELVNDILNYLPWGEISSHTAQDIADHLIANGVTFGEDINVPNNPYWENVCAMADRQRAKGMATYGQGIEMNPADAITRIEYLQEELIDALMYCEWIKDSIHRVPSEIEFDYEAEDMTDVEN